MEENKTHTIVLTDEQFVALQLGLGAAIAAAMAMKDTGMVNMLRRIIHVIAPDSYWGLKEDAPASDQPFG